MFTLNAPMRVERQTAYARDTITHRDDLKDLSILLAIVEKTIRDK